MSKSYYFQDTTTGLVVGAFIGPDSSLAANTPAGSIAVEGELPAAVAPVVDAAWAARARRDALLSASDWTQISDVVLPLAVKTAWATYRAALRNIPLVAGFPVGIVWPIRPEPVTLAER